MKQITVWQRFNEESKQFDHNHIEDGYIESLFPNSKLDIDGKSFSAQKNWKNSKWKRIYATLVENKVLYD